MASCPICDHQIDDSSDRKKCNHCGNGDRTRTVYNLYKTLKPLTVRENALIFTAENWLPDSMFMSAERSIYLGKNHLDIQKIDRESNTYGRIASNHVLEHVQDDSSAMREMYRVLAQGGTLQLTVPTPGRVYKSNNWGYADKTKMGHFRNYGADFLSKLKAELPSAYILCVIISDTLTSFTDIVYLISKTPNRMEAVANAAIKGGSIVVPIPKLD